MAKNSCNGCERRKVKIAFCVKLEKNVCRDCCVKDIKMIGKCTYWPLCW